MKLAKRLAERRLKAEKIRLSDLYDRKHRHERFQRSFGERAASIDRDEKEIARCEKRIAKLEEAVR